MKKWWLALAWLVAASFVRPPAPAVRTRSGWLRGVLAPGGRFYQYSGVPYATVNCSNRFQAPLPPPKWEGVYEAIQENLRCPQVMYNDQVFGEEDCLKLSIYTPLHQQPGKLLPVMAYIHGGCFFEGTGSGFLYGADYFVEHGVIFVGINYRLNVEGFLCLGIKEAPGNAGLKDQIAALKWIQDNIANFGGNPGNVTLFGESAGAVSISYLILSPSAKGLFHRAILQSGSSLAPWGTQHDPLRTASNLVKQFGYNTNDPHKIYNILSKKSISELINAIKYSQHRNYITAETLFAPCVERDIPGITPILTQYPADIILTGNYTKIPMIIGFTNKEGIYFVAKDYGSRVDEVDPTELIQADLDFPTEELKNEAAESIQEQYFANQKQNMVSELVDLYSDLHFKFPSIKESELYARTTDQPIYYYLFKYNGLYNFAKFTSNFWWAQGASHADELFYLFKPHTFPIPFRYFESEMITRMVTLWTNFAIYNEPTPRGVTKESVHVRWRPGAATNPEVLVIDSRLTRRRLWHIRTLRFWNETYAKYRRKNYGFFGSI